jgi:hypothetical protein
MPRAMRFTLSPHATRPNSAGEQRRLKYVDCEANVFGGYPKSQWVYLTKMQKRHAAHKDTQGKYKKMHQRAYRWTFGILPAIG